MKTFLILAALLKHQIVELCNAGIAKAVKCNINKPGQCANAIGCNYFYSTTVYYGCATTTLTVYKPQQTVTRVAQKTITTTSNQPDVEQTSLESRLTIDTFTIETSLETAVVETQTQTVTTTVATETSTVIENTATSTIQQTITEVTTLPTTLTTSIPPQVGPAFPGNQKRSVPTKHIFSPVELAELHAQIEETDTRDQAINRRGLSGYEIKYPQHAPGTVKSCLNPRSYSAACGCFGAHAKTITKPASIKTVTVTRTKPVVTSLRTYTVTAVVTNPQVTKLVTLTTTIVQLATGTITETTSITVTTAEVESITAEEIITISTETATTTVNTITQTSAQVVATATQTANPFPAGGTCGCRQSFRRGTRVANPRSDYFFNVSTQQSFADCARACDTVFACNVIDYNILTGECQQANDIPAETILDSAHYFGTVVLGPRCGQGCAG